LIKLSLTLGWLAVCGAALAILMPWYIVTRLGVGAQTDAFFASGALPQLIFLIVSTSLTHVLVPLLTTQEGKAFRQDAWGFFIGVTAIFSALALVLNATAAYWVPRLVPGFSAQGKALTVSLTRIQLVSMICNASVAVLWSVCYARRKFIWAELSSIMATSVALLFLVVMLPRHGIIAAAWATVLNMGLKLALLLPLLGRWQRPRWDSHAIREAWRRLKPSLLGQTYYKTEPLVDRFLTSMTSAGGLSLYYIAQQVYSVINLVLNKAFSAPMVPALAVAAQAGDWLAYRRIYRERLWWVVCLVASGYVILIVAGNLLLPALIGQGGITAENVRALWWIMIALGGALAGGAAGQLTSVAFYAMGDTKTPTKLFVWTYTIYVPIKVAAFLRYGLLGLAITTSLHLLVNFLLQLNTLEKTTSPQAEPRPAFARR
jgi:putative peptidoglycan lipid II flippase